MEYTTLNNGVKMPMAGIGTFLLTPDEAENSVLSALKNGYRLVDTNPGCPVSRFFWKPSYGPASMSKPDAVEKTLERLDTDYIDRKC